MPVEMIGGHCPTLQQLPIGSLKMFGMNPYGEAIFRVIWSESRYYLVGANHREYDNAGPANDKTIQLRGKDPNLNREYRGYKWLPLYPGSPRWIIEQWKSSTGFTGCSREQYELLYRDPVSNLLTLGPYPERGEYCECAVNLSQSPTREEVFKKIYLIKAGWGFNYASHKAANDEAVAKTERDKYNTFKDMFLDSQQAFGNKPVNIRPGKKTKEKVELKYTAQEVGLGNSSGFNTGTPR